MAISKERLEELIKQGATIWYVGKDYSVNANRMVDIRLGKFNKIENDYLLVKAGDGFHTPRYNFVAYLDGLFETRKQAEWHLKYHATRTEELNLPMWEEIEKIKEKDVYIIAKPKEMRFYIDYKFLIPQIKLCTLEDVFNWNLDEEGYLSACDLCLKLFKGEEEC